MECPQLPSLPIKVSGRATSCLCSAKGIRRNCSFHMIDLIFGYVVLRVDVPLLIAYACFHRGFVGLLDVFHDQVGPLHIVLCSDQDGKGTSWLVAGPHVNRPCLFFIYLGFGC